jgi:hypothetical protein
MIDEKTDADASVFFCAAPPEAFWCKTMAW